MKAANIYINGDSNLFLLVDKEVLEMGVRVRMLVDGRKPTDYLPLASFVDINGTSTEMVETVGKELGLKIDRPDWCVGGRRPYPMTKHDIMLIRQEKSDGTVAWLFVEPDHR